MGYLSSCMLLSVITGIAIALHCCKAHSKINRKMGNSTPCKIVTPENIILWTYELSLKLCTRDYVGKITRHANFGKFRYSGGFSPNRRNITTLWLFLTVLSCPVLTFAQVEPLNRFSRFMAQTTCFRARMVLLGVRTMSSNIRGNMPPKLPKMGVNRQIQAKTAKYKNSNISKTINRINTKFEDQAETGNCT